MLTPDEILYYDNKEVVEGAGETRHWVYGGLFERERICIVLDRCLEEFPGDAIEIGCLTGGTTRLIAPIVSKHRRVLVCVDPWTPGDYWGNDMESTFRGFESMLNTYVNMGHAEIIRGFSQATKVIEQIKKHKYAFAFIDGDHSYETALADLQLMMPITKGMIIVDDLNLGGVDHALQHALNEFPEWGVAMRTTNCREAHLRRR